jgi:hypothetical protein
MPSPVQASEVQGLLSLGGLSSGSTVSVHTEDEQIFFLQPPTGAVPQSTSVTQLTGPVLVEVEVEVDPPPEPPMLPVVPVVLPPAPLPGHFSRSVQSSGANRHPGAHAARASAPTPARTNPDRT